MINWWVDRQFVWDSDRQIIAALRAKMISMNPAQTGAAFREARKDLYRKALERHHANQALVAEFRL